MGWIATDLWSIYSSARTLFLMPHGIVYPILYIQEAEAAKKAKEKKEAEAKKKKVRNFFTTRLSPNSSMIEAHYIHTRLFLCRADHLRKTRKRRGQRRKPKLGKRCVDYCSVQMLCTRFMVHVRFYHSDLQAPTNSILLFCFQ